jgi:GNAT superfamily N-acetyltransferase
MPAAGKDDAATKPKLTFKPVTRAREDDFVAVFARPGGPKYCWCMAWRSTGEELKANTPAARKGYILERIRKRVPVGLVGYLDGDPVAWVSVAPRDTYRRLGGPEARPGEDIWSLACMYMRRNLRGAGLGHDLIAAAVAHARKKGATILEAYPVEPDSPSYRFIGLIPAYEAVGFKEVGTAGSRRHVMRLTLSATKRAKS